MRPPCETVQREMLPVLRTKLARALKKKGLSQTEISKSMDVTQAAVSKYLNQRLPRTELSCELDALVQRLVDMLQEPSNSADLLVKEICSACMISRVGSNLCKMHQRNVPSLDKVNCQICSELLGGQDKAVSGRVEVLEDMREALRSIESSSSFHLVVPQVRANLVACNSEADMPEDVAGVPGRITVIGGRARVLVGPQFGTSQHTARILLHAKKMWERTRACLCISGSGAITRLASSAGIVRLAIRNPETDAIRIIDSLSQSARARGRKSAFPAIHVPGGIGVEPILYIFGSSAAEVTRKGIELSELLV